MIQLKEMCFKELIKVTEKWELTTRDMICQVIYLSYILVFNINIWAENTVGFSQQIKLLFFSNLSSNQSFIAQLLVCWGIEVESMAANGDSSYQTKNAKPFWNFICSVIIQ